MDSPTNQVFIVLSNEQLAALEGKAKFGFWEKYDDTHTVVSHCHQLGHPDGRGGAAAGADVRAHLPNGGAALCAGCRLYFLRGYAILNWIKAALCAPWKDGLYYGLF